MTFVIHTCGHRRLKKHTKVKGIRSRPHHVMALLAASSLGPGSRLCKHITQNYVVRATPLVFINIFYYPFPIRPLYTYAYGSEVYFSVTSRGYFYHTFLYTRPLFQIPTSFLRPLPALSALDMGWRIDVSARRLAPLPPHRSHRLARVALPAHLGHFSGSICGT